MALIFIFILLLNTLLLGQQQNLDNSKTVARAGSFKITTEEFKNRFNFSPHPRYGKSIDTSQIKKDYLYTLIAEKLLAQKAKELKLDTSKYINEILNYLNKLFVRDAYYRLEISDKVKISSEDIKEAKERYAKLLIVKYLYSEDRNEINKLYSQLKRGASIDSLLLLRYEYKEQKIPGSVTFGTLEKNLEDSLYNLKPVEFTIPLKTGRRWYIFKLIEIIRNPEAGKGDLGMKLTKIIEDRKTEEQADDFLYKFLHNQKIEVDKDLFFKILKSMDKLVDEKKSIYKNSRYTVLEGDDFQEVINSLGKEIYLPFIKFETNPETVQEFLTNLKYSTLKVDSAGLNNLGWVLNKYVRDHIQNELLVREAYKMGIQNSPSVKKDLQIWENYYLAQKLERMIFDSIYISDGEAYNFYSKNNNQVNASEEVHIKKILTDSLDKIEDALRDINNGLSFEDAAKKYSIDSSRERGGDIGYLHATAQDQIGKFAADMNIGDLYGPIKTSCGYALIKLIDKRKSGKQEKSSFEDIKKDVIETLKGIELRKRLSVYVARLASEYGIEINNDIFDRITVNQINTITVRMIGFGGKIYAFPYEPLFPDWYKVYKERKEELVQ